MQGACNVAAPHNVGIQVDLLLPMAEGCRTVQDACMDNLHCLPHVIIHHFRHGIAFDLQLNTGWPIYSF